jgi:Fe-Mn family superoxide dismutase
MTPNVSERALPYHARTFKLHGLEGISDRTMEVHLKLYEGYVKEVNRFTEMLAEIIADKDVDQEEMPAYSELKRRFAFEENGVILHEHYFENLAAGEGGDPPGSSRFVKATERSFGDYEVWKADFLGVGKMRGVGWAICYENPVTGRLSNHWITLHDIGHAAGYNPVLVMDVWEHAYILDYEPAERPKYIEAFFANIAWKVVEKRLRGGPQAAR